MKNTATPKNETELTRARIARKIQRLEDIAAEATRQGFIGLLLELDSRINAVLTEKGKPRYSPTMDPKQMQEPKTYRPSISIRRTINLANRVAQDRRDDAVGMRPMRAMKYTKDAERAERIAALLQRGETTRAHFEFKSQDTEVRELWNKHAREMGAPTRGAFSLVLNR